MGDSKRFGFDSVLGLGRGDGGGDVLLYISGPLRSGTAGTAICWAACTIWRCSRT